MFMLTSGNLTKEIMANALLKVLPKIINVARTVTGPWIYRVDRTGKITKRELLTP